MEQDDEVFVFFRAPGTMIVLEPWWRRMGDRDQEFLEHVRIIEGQWEDFIEWEETYEDLTGAAEIRGERAMRDAIAQMSWLLVDQWMVGDLASWNWRVRRRNRRASRTGQLTLAMWEGRAYVIDPLTGWWIEEAVPDQWAEAV